MPKLFKITQESKLVLFIIMLVVTSQLALTIYLPSLPHMVSFFKTNRQLIQLSLTIYLIGYGASQFFYGPLSDIYGRRKIILSGVSIFTVASLMCTFSGNSYFFLLSRLLQGIGIGCGDTMGRAILCDRFKDSAFVKAACHIGFAATLTPMLGPVIGSYIEVYANWKISFFIIFLYSLGSLIVFYFYLPETKPSHFNPSRSLIRILKTYFSIFTNRTFINYFLPGAACFLGEIAFNLTSPFLLQNRLGWSPVGFAWLNILIIIGLLLGTCTANLLARRISYKKMVLSGMYILSVSTIFMLVPALLEIMNSSVIIIPMFFFMMGVGIIYPNTNTGALRPFSIGVAGTAGALQGGLQMLVGGLLGAWLSHISTKTQLPLALTLAALTLAIHAVFILLLPSKNLYNSSEDAKTC